MRNIFVVILLFVTVALFAEGFTPTYTPPNPFSAINSGSLLNPYKLKMSNSASFMATASSNSHSFYQSMYTNHIQYDFSPALKMNVDLNVVNYGTASWNNKFNVKSNGDNQTKLLPDFSMEYKPNDNFIIRFDYQHANTQNFVYSRPWWSR